MPSKRYLQNDILEDLDNKMVFLAGPRQTGKTTLAEQLIEQKPTGLYYSWDNSHDRKQMMKAGWPSEPHLIVFDELHKYRHWKRWIKGEYDKHKNRHQFLLTGSARMDIYRRGGDSLQGRYHHYRLHPFSYNEILNRLPSITPFNQLDFKSTQDQKLLQNLLDFSGFPEPFLSGNKRAHRRWQKERVERFFREDIRDLENIRDLSSMQLLSDLLPDRAASLLSLNSLREDLEVSHRAITNWMNIFERLYFSFRLYPYKASPIRSLKKEAKLYLWDWSLIQNQGARFENLIASHLLKFCHYLEDREGYKIALHYLRDVDKREVDFLVTVDKKPWFAVEVKMQDDNLSPHLAYFTKRLKIPFSFQIILEGKKDFMVENIRIMPAAKFLSALL